jgi:hypothetical protein
MRCAHALVVGLTLFAAATGCRNQSAPLTNPFLTPQRVPPPSTRVLTPGTAQPYYPGDPLPGAAPVTGFPATSLAPPATAYPPTGAPPATAYPSGPAYPMNTITPTPAAQPAPITPPGGWGGYPSSAQNTRTGDAVSVPNDGQQLRFASAPLPTPAFTPNAGVQNPVQQAAFNEPPAQRVQVREVAPAEYLSSPASTTSPAASTPSRDGFRPQGSEPRAEVPGESPIGKGFRSPTLARNAVTASGGATERFGVGAQQEWLRGQLEFWPQTGEWSIRYMPDGQVDQIGGRILIDNPQVLGNLPPGEMVMVQGQVFGRQIDESSWRPAYRVAVVQRQR